MENELTIAQALKLAVEKHNQGNLQEAKNIYEKILEKDKTNSDAWHLLGLVFFQLKDYVLAIEKIKKAIELNSNSALYFGNLAMVYDAVGDEENSTKCFERALEINPHYNKAHLAHFNLGIFFRDKGEFEKALEHYDAAIKLKNDFFDARWNRSLVLLFLGRFDEAWEDYECRFKKDSPTDLRIFNKPKWDGSFLNGKKILVLSEQGFGDNIQFVRYISLIKEKGGYVILECKKEIRKLFQGFVGVDEFVDKTEDFSKIDFDCYIHLMSLPGIFKTNLKNIPKKIPYLKPDSFLVEKFKTFFDKTKFNIGIVWAGNPNQVNDKNRSTSFENFKILNGIPEVKFYSLQKGEATNQIFGTEVIDLSRQINDFSDTAAIIENLDLIISVDTSVAHLAGALGKPTWTLLTFIPDWRWFFKGKNCVWYPSMKLFRQKKSGDWKSVFEEVKIELEKLVRKI